MIKIKDVMAITKKSENKQLEKRFKSMINTDGNILLKDLVKELKGSKLRLFGRSGYDDYKAFLKIKDYDDSEWFLLLSISLY